MNIKIGNIEMGTFEGAYQLKEDGKNLGYYPSFRDMLAAFADTEIGKVNADSVNDLIAALERIEKAVTETALRHLPRFVTETGEPEELSDEPGQVLSLTERTFIAVAGRSPNETQEDGLLMGKIIAMHRLASGIADDVSEKKDIIKQVALTYYASGDEKSFRELPHARRLATVTKSILKPWFEEREKQ